MKQKVRESWDSFFIRVVLLMATRSTCSRVQVGAVLTQDRRIISTGYNGVAGGATHCPDDLTDEAHHLFAVGHEIHAEANALLFAARHGLAVEGTTLYVNVSPCQQCAKLILQAGVARVCYYEVYDREDSGIQYLVNHGVACDKLLRLEENHEA